MSRYTQQEVFIIVPESVYVRADLSQTAKLLYGIVNAFSAGASFCYLTNDQLCQRLALKPSAVHDARRQLLQQGLIEQKRLKGNVRVLKTVGCGKPQPTMRKTATKGAENRNPAFPVRGAENRNKEKEYKKKSTHTADSAVEKAERPACKEPKTYWRCISRECQVEHYTMPRNKRCVRCGEPCEPCEPVVVA